MTLDDLCEVLDELSISGDTPLRFRSDDGTYLQIDAVTGHTNNGTVEIILGFEED